MLTIKWFLADSGSTAQVAKNFPIYQGQYANVLLNICVPATLLAPRFSEYAGNYENVATPYVAGTAVKVSARTVARNGLFKESDGYYCRYVKTFNKDGIDYALYERKLPKEFTLYSGQGVTAPTIIANVINVEYGDIAKATVVSSNSALTVAVDLAVAKTAVVAVSQNYTYTYSSISGKGEWYLNGEVVSLSKYGITVSGTANEFDTITLVITASTPTVLQVATTQTFPLDVLPSSSLLDNDTAVDTTDLALLQSELQAVKSTVADKQDKADNQLQTSVKTVVGAINGLNTNVIENTANIDTNTTDIADLKDEVDGIKQTLATGEHYIGSLDVNEHLPTDEELNNFVISIMGDGYTITSGDVVIVTVVYATATDHNYKYFYSENGWDYYELPLIETASNGNAGIMAGTYGVGSKNTTLVDIVGGEIVNIYIQATDGTYKNVRTVLNSQIKSLADILDGSTAVGLATKATQDGKGNVIADTYQTATAGATKLYVKDYALPREFNDIYYLTRNGYAKEPEVDWYDPVATVTTSGVGDWQLINETLLNSEYEYELSRKNTCNNSFYISTDKDCTVQVRLTTIFKDSTGAETELAIELTDNISFTANTLKRVDIQSIFSYLNDSVIKVEDGDRIIQWLEIVSTDLNSITFNAFSNQTYPSTFNLNTTAQVIYHTLGNLGELPLYELACTDEYISDDNIQFIGNADTKLYNNVECLVKLTIPYTAKSYDEFSATKEILLTLGGVAVRVASPYNYQSGNARFSQVSQVAHWQDETSGIFYVMKGTMKVSETDGATFVVDEDDLGDFYNTLKDNFVTVDTAQNVSGVKSFTDHIKTPQVANLNGGAMVRYKDTEGKTVFGGVGSGCVLMGSGDRPTYSKSGSDFTGTEIALKSDIDSAIGDISTLLTALDTGTGV